jgi:hypothetical protein
MRFTAPNAVIGLVKDGAKLACASVMYVRDAWYHTAPDYKEPEPEIKDANPMGVSGHGYFWCEREDIDASDYHSDDPKVKLGEPDFNVNSEYDINDTIDALAAHDWKPRIPHTSRELWALQRYLSVFRKIAGSYNKWLKSIDKEIKFLKRSKKKDEARITYLFSRKKGRKFISGIWVFDTYCDRVSVDPEVARWIVHNWDALNIKDDYEKSDIEDRMPMARNENGDWEEREFASDAYSGVAEHTRYTNEEMWIIGYVAKMLIKRPYICAKKVTDSKARTRIKVHLLDLIDLYEDVKHPSTERWEKWSKMTRAKLEAEVEAEERRLRYEADIF